MDIKIYTYFAIYSLDTDLRQMSKSRISNSSLTFDSHLIIACLIKVVIHKIPQMYLAFF